MTYVISDLHGHMDVFKRMLKQIEFDHEKDTLIINGDVIDRGPDGMEILTWAYNNRDNGVKMIMGNHELMMLEFFIIDDYATKRGVMQDWYANGGKVTHQAIVKLAKVDEAKLKDLLVWVADLPLDMDLNVNGKDFHIVHGWPGEDMYDKVWGRPIAFSVNPFGEDTNTLIVGHTPVISLPEGIGVRYDENTGGAYAYHGRGWIDIDCGGAYIGMYSGARQACIRLDDMKEFYEE